MKSTKVKKETKEFSAAVGRALRRAAKVARKTGAHARNSHLHLEERQSCRGEAVIRSMVGVARDLFKVVPQLIEELKKRKGA